MNAAYGSVCSIYLSRWIRCKVLSIFPVPTLPEASETQPSMDISTSSKGMGNPTCAAHPTASNPSPPTPLLFYDPPPAHIFTLDEIRAKKSRLTRQAYIHGLIEHPVGALIEYPQSGSAPDVGIGHIFNVDLNSSEFTNPRSISQYSLGEPQGYHRNVTCLQLRDSQTDEPVVCLQKKSSCKS